MADRSSWWGRRSLRARLTILAAAVLAVALAGGSLLLIVTMQRSLLHELDAGARRTAGQIGTLLDTGTSLPAPLPVGDGNTVAVQVVNSSGQVLGASAFADRLEPLLAAAQLRAVRGGRVLTEPGDLAGVNNRLRVSGLAAGPASAPDTVVVAVNADQVADAARVTRDQLAIGCPILLVGACWLTWFVVGRALRPVEGLRRGAENISGTDARIRQLPVPRGDDEVHRLAVTLNSMLGRLDEAAARQRGFVADAAHELRSPLASLRTQLEVAQHLRARADWPATAAGALIDITRLSRLVEDLLLLARIDDASSAQRTEGLTDVAALCRDVVGSYRDGAAVPVILDAPSVCVPARCEADALRRVLRNLLDNALRHTRTRVVVHVTAAAQVVVTDDGAGIPAAERDRVFERFTRLDAARASDAGGSGLGLAIVAQLVASQHGSITMTDAVPPPGLAVTVTLRRAAPAPDQRSGTPSGTSLSPA